MGPTLWTNRLGPFWVATHTEKTWCEEARASGGVRKPRGWHRADTGERRGLSSSPTHGARLAEAGRGQRQNTAPLQWGQRRTHSETRARSHAVQQSPDHSFPLLPLCWCQFPSCLFGLSGQRTHVSREANGKFLSNQKGDAAREGVFCLLPARRSPERAEEDTLSSRHVLSSTPAGPAAWGGGSGHHLSIQVAPTHRVGQMPAPTPY